MASLVDFSISDIGGILTSAREAITGKKITDPTELAKIDLQLQTLAQASRDGQIAINKIEANHKSIFVAGWRPFIGWVCGVALAYAYVLQPIIEWGVSIANITMPQTIIVDGKEVITQVLISTPVIDTDTLYQLVLALLGMATLRTYEKIKEVAREN